MKAHERLEYEWGARVGFPPENVVACSSGTAALHLALEALELTPGSRVILPDLTMVACARAVTLAGLRPVFVGCREDLLMDDGHDAMGEAQVEPYSAFMAVHVYGRRVDMDWISSTAGVCHPVIEDLAEAHYIMPHPSTDAACWSFYKNKVVAGEEGGAVAFRDPERARLARQLRCLGFTEAHDFTHTPRGHNYRLADLLAEPILRSIRLDGEKSLYPRDGNPELKFRSWRGMRETVVGWYDAECPDRWRMPPRETPWVYDLRVPGMTRHEQDRVVALLRAAGVEARHCFKPMHTLEEYKGCEVYGDVGLTEMLSREVIYLPIGQPGVITRNTTRLAFGLLRGELAAYL